MNKREIEKLNTILAKLESLQNSTKDMQAKDGVNRAKTALMEVLRRTDLMSDPK